jgi:hypothetical protein
MIINSFSLSREQQLALLIVALIGAALGTVLGYFVYAVGWGEGALPFENWILQPFRGAILWALFGAVIGGASIFVRNLMREPINSTASSRTAVVQSIRTHQDRPQERSQESPQGRWIRPPRSQP